MTPDPDPVPPQILDAVAAARRALADLRLEEKILAVDLIQYWLEVEIASWERAADPRTH
jgi:hypothetical protein